MLGAAMDCYVCCYVCVITMHACQDCSQHAPCIMYARAKPHVGCVSKVAGLLDGQQGYALHESSAAW